MQKTSVTFHKNLNERNHTNVVRQSIQPSRSNNDHIRCESSESGIIRLPSEDEESGEYLDVDDGTVSDSFPDGPISH